MIFIYYNVIYKAHTIQAQRRWRGGRRFIADAAGSLLLAVHPTPGIGVDIFSWEERAGSAGSIARLALIPGATGARRASRILWAGFLIDVLGVRYVSQCDGH
jgi:hypothetical protein